MQPTATARYTAFSLPLTLSDSRFKIVVMPDIAALGSDSNAVVEIIASVAASLPPIT